MVAFIPFLSQQKIQTRSFIHGFFQCFFVWEVFWHGSSVTLIVTLDETEFDGKKQGHNRDRQSIENCWPTVCDFV